MSLWAIGERGGGGGGGGEGEGGWLYMEKKEKKKEVVFLQQTLDTKVSRVSAAVASGGSSFHSVMVLGRNGDCLDPLCGTVVVVVAGRGLD